MDNACAWKPSDNLASFLNEDKDFVENTVNCIAIPDLIRFDNGTPVSI
jgi:hypothetical protein